MSISPFLPRPRPPTHRDPARVRAAGLAQQTHGTVITSGLCVDGRLWGPASPLLQPHPSSLTLLHWPPWVSADWVSVPSLPALIH